MCSIGSVISGLPRPTSTAVPAGRTALMPSKTARAEPLASTNALTSNPAVATSVSAGSMTRVAPNDSARSRRSATRSVTMISAAPNARAVCAQMMPIGPAPAIRMDDPGVTPALRMVVIATDSGSSSAAASSEMASGSRWAKSVRMTQNCAKAPSIGGVA